MATFKEVLSYLLGKDTGGSGESYSTGPKINPQTNLPSVASTIASVKPVGTSAGWFSEPVVTSEPPRWQGAASAGHPAGDAMRQDPYQYRRGGRSYGQEHPQPPRWQERPYLTPPGHDRRGSWFGDGDEQQGGMSAPPPPPPPPPHPEGPPPPGYKSW